MKWRDGVGFVRLVATSKTASPNVHRTSVHCTERSQTWIGARSRSAFDSCICHYHMRPGVQRDAVRSQGFSLLARANGYDAWVIEILAACEG